MRRCPLHRLATLAGTAAALLVGPGCSDGRVATEHGLLTCSEIRHRVDDRKAAAKAQHDACVVDADCTFASAETRCMGECPFAVSVAGQAEFAAAIDRIDDEYCAHFTDACGYVTPGCALGEAACVAGHCQWREPARGEADAGASADAGDEGAPDVGPDPGPDPGTDAGTEPEVTADAAAADVDAGPTPPVTCPGADEVEAGMLVWPYLQSPTPGGMWILWETEVGDESRVDWGPTGALGGVACGTWLESGQGARVHEVQLSGLEPATRYFYRVKTGATVSGVLDFVTPPARDSEAPFRFVALGDTQRDSDQPDKLREIIEEGVMASLEAAHGPDLPSSLGALLIAGDLVDSGWDYWQWADEFFASVRSLVGRVPLLPVPGNHEGNSYYYWTYFHAPDNGTPEWPEHWWYADFSNVRIVGLDSNDGYRTDGQLTWLEGVLDDACGDEDLDFVLAQLHHPFKSELWLPGETDWTGGVVERMESFSTTCGKPSAHLFGHTHGYSRGQSRDHRHLWVNVSSGGGAIDYWGEQEQANYDEFTVSQDEWGFVVVEAQAGADPELRLRRVSRGDDAQSLDNVVRDEVTLRLFDQPPAQPTAVSPTADVAASAPVTLVASPFADPDGDAHQASHWQVAAACDGFDAPLFDRWRQSADWYEEVDLQAGDDLGDEVADGLEAGQAYCWRVRYRDDGLRWSAWSEPATFTLAGE